MLIGARIDETTTPKPSWLPTRAVCTSAHKRLPDADMVDSCCCVSPLFKDVIEAFDPGVHQFFPIRIVSKKRLFEEATHYLLNICTRKDTIDTEQSGFEFVIKNGKRFVYNAVFNQTKRVLRSNDIPGHVWREDLLTRDVYFSDEVFKAAVKAGVKGLRNSYIVKI